jgi:hypothetical protein
MSSINFSPGKWMTVFLLLTTIIGCSPKIDSSLFYKYRKDKDGYFWFNGIRYSIYINEWEIYSLPKPVKKYLLKSNLANKERITEIFYKYDGSIKLEGFSILNIKKHYRINEHSSALEPRFLSEGKSFPVKAEIELNQEAKIKAKSLGIKLMKGINTQSLATDDVCVLKYLANMVWYPTAFLNANITWSPVVNDSIVDVNSILLSVHNEKLNASGQLVFDSVTSMPVSFIGDITDNMESQFSMNKFEITYSDYKKFGSYYLPQHCIATIETEDEYLLTIKMNLESHTRPDFEKYFEEEEE